MLVYTTGGNATWYSHFGRQFGSFLQNQTYSYHMTMLAGIYPKELNICAYTNTITPPFTAVPFIIITQSWNQPRRQVGEWINSGTCKQQNIIHH